MEIIVPGFLDHVLAFILCIVFPLMAVLQVRAQMAAIRFDAATKKVIYISNGIVLWIGAALTLAIWLIYDRPIIDLGFRFPDSESGHLWWLLLVVFIFLFAIDMFSELRNSTSREKTVERWKESMPFMPSSIEDLGWFLFLCITAGFCEELVFRGYLIQYFISLSGPDNLVGFNLAVWFPALFFAIVHIYQGKEAVFKIIVMAGIFGYIFIYSSSIWPLILVHFVMNYLQGWIGVYILKFPAVDEEE